MPAGPNKALFRALSNTKPYMTHHLTNTPQFNPRDGHAMILQSTAAQPEDY